MSICIYDFSGKQVYCFSDLEGRIPYLYPSVEKVPNVLNVNKVINILKATQANLENEAIIFTGDLIDRGPHNIQLLQRMLHLKEKNENSVLLAMGNRDLNKIRMIDEYYITFTDVNKAGQPCWFGYKGSFWGLCNDVAEKFGNDYKFKFNHEQLSGPLLNTTQTGWQNFKVASDLKGIFADTLRERIIAVE